MGNKTNDCTNRTNDCTNRTHDCTNRTNDCTNRTNDSSSDDEYANNNRTIQIEEGVDGYFARPGHCDQFIICSNGFAYIMNCPAGLYFNPATKVCDYDSIVDCN